LNIETLGDYLGYPFSSFFSLSPPYFEARTREIPEKNTRKQKSKNSLSYFGESSKNILFFEKLQQAPHLTSAFKKYSFPACATSESVKMS
jgi:hypothetical protein